MCQLCGCRISIFFVRWGKNKKHSVDQRVGLDAVLLQYGLYVFGHLSKWFVFVLMFKIWSVCRVVNGRPTIGYNVCRFGVVADFQHKCSFEKLHLNLPLNCHTEHCTRHYAKPLLSAALLSFNTLSL
jgi:hypothetical protein